MGDTPEIVIENHDANVTLTEKPDQSTRRPSNDAIGANLDKDLFESLINLEHELTGIDTRKTLAEGSRLCDEITLETNKLAKLIESLSTETKPADEEVQQVITGFTTKVNDLIKYHHDNKLTDKAEVDHLKTGVEKITAAIHGAASDPAQTEEAQRILHIFIKNVDQVDGAYKAVRRRMSTTPTSAQVASPPKLNLSGHARQESSESATSSNQNTERSAGNQSVPTTPTAKNDGGMKHSNTTPDFKKKKSYSVSSKKSKSKLADNEIEAAPADGEEKDDKKVKRGHSRRTTLSLVLPLKKEKKEDEEKKEKEKEKKDKKSKTPRDEDKKKKFSIKDSWKRLTSAFVPNSKEDKRHTMATAETGDAIDWDAQISPRKEKKEKEKELKKEEKEREKLEKEKEKELKKEEKEKEKEREKQEKEQENKEPKSPRRLRLSLSMRKKTKSKREDSTMIKSSPASTARDGSATDRTEASSTSQHVTPRVAGDPSSEEKGPSSSGKAATNSIKELPRTNEGPETPKVPDTPDTPKVPDTPKLAISPITTPANQTPTQGSTPRNAHSPRAVLVREISKKMLVAKRAPSQQQMRVIKTKLSQMKLAWDEYTAGGLTTQDVSEIDEHALDADIKELENMEGFDVDDLVNFEPDGPAIDEANMTDELNALDNILDEFDDEFDTPSMREPSSLSKVAAGPGSNSYLSAYD